MRPYWENVQPLRIPSGWVIDFNAFMDIEPEELNPDPNDNKWLTVFVQDIFQISKHFSRKINKKVQQQQVIIDLGWYPDGDPSGQFRLVAILDNNWEFPLLQFCSRKKKEVVETLEYWLFGIFDSIYFIEENVFRQQYKNEQ